MTATWEDMRGGGFSDLWAFDSIEFIVDGDHSGGQFSAYDAEELGAAAYARINNSQAQQYAAIAESPDRRTLWYAGAANGWVTSPPYAAIGTYEQGEEPGITGYEFYVTPWDDLDSAGPDLSRPSKLESGRIVGFHIAVRDYDERPGPGGAFDIFYPYSPYRGSFCIACSADESLDGELVPCHILDCGAAPAGSPTVSAVAGDSWARIKAAFTVDRRSSR